MSNNFTFITNSKNNSSSALCFDIRDSTKIIKELNTIERIKFHASIISEIKEMFYREIKSNVFINDKGDGLLVLHNGIAHAWKIFNLGVAICDYLNTVFKEKYESFLRKSKINCNFNFGMGIHSGSSLIVKGQYVGEYFMYGVLLNSVARLESFTKVFENTNVLMTDHFINVP